MSLGEALQELLKQLLLMQAQRPLILVIPETPLVLLLLGQKRTVGTSPHTFLKLRKGQHYAILTHFSGYVAGIKSPVFVSVKFIEEQS